MSKEIKNKGEIIITDSKGNIVFEGEGSFSCPAIERKEPKFKPGDKVVPISKSVGGTWYEWVKANNKIYQYFKQNGYLIVDGSDLCGRILLGCSELHSNYFLESDLIPYVEPKPELRGFKIGDKVQVVDGGYHVGKKGIIAEILDGGRIGLESDMPFENLSSIWDKNHPDKIGKGFYTRKEYIVLLSTNLCPHPYTERYIFNGPATICIIEQDGKQYKGVVKCYYKDTWDAEIGRQEAYKKAVLAQQMQEHDLPF